MAGSVSDRTLVDVEASARGQGAPALAHALAQVFRKLVAAGAAPPHLVSVTFSGDDPGALHPARPEIRRVWCEAFGGFRPQISVRYAPGDSVSVHARAEPPASPPPSAPVYRGYDVAEVARQMSPRGQVADMGAVFAKWTSDGAAARAQHAGLDIAYGPEREQTLDLYRPVGVARPPVWVFIHGGYWQASSKDQHAQFCSGMLKAGFAVANIDYGLAPETPLARIVEHTRAALSFLVREADNLGVDASQMHVAGHSAGGHLAACMACDPHAPPVRSAHLLSGVLDLEPLLHLPMGRILGLQSPNDAARLSPVKLAPRNGARVALAVGGKESDEFKRQSADLARLWGAPGPLIVKGANHFDLLDGLIEGALLQQALGLCRG
ncbi:MAG: Alpha/beta hydrolase fold [Hyphomicrobiales bacterium]|nr:Alpha/beta hydrolase fold [Hyphomicrobiales bacterium]